MWNLRLCWDHCSTRKVGDWSNLGRGSPVGALAFCSKLKIWNSLSLHLTLLAIYFLKLYPNEIPEYILSENLCISLLFYLFWNYFSVLNFFNANDSFILPLAHDYPLNHLSLDYLLSLRVFLGWVLSLQRLDMFHYMSPIQHLANAGIFSHQNSCDKWQCCDFKEVSQWHSFFFTNPS